MPRDERIMSGLLNAFPHPALVFDESGLVVSANEDCAQLLGRSARELEGELVRELCHSPDGLDVGAERSALVRAAGEPLTTCVAVRRVDMGAEAWSLLVILADAGRDGATTEHYAG